MKSQTSSWLILVTMPAATGCDRTDDWERTGLRETVEIEVEMVGPGVISTDLPEFASAVTPDGDTIYFNRTSPDRSSIELLYAVRTAGAWSEPRPFPPTQEMTAIDPFLSSDGGRLYFASAQVREGAGNESLSIGYVERGPSDWGEPRDVGEPINSDSADYFISVASDGTAAFSSTRTGTLEIYVSPWTLGGWSDPEIVMLEGVSDASNPLISQDGSFLVVSATGPNGSTDLMVTCRAATGWGPVHLLPAPVNSGFAEFAPAIAGGYLYFTSERPGMVGPQPDSIRPPGDLYRTPSGLVSDLCQPSEQRF